MRWYGSPSGETEREPKGLNEAETTALGSGETEPAPKESGEAKTVVSK